MSESWFGFIDKRLTLGNIATMILVVLAWVFSGTVKYTNIKNHVEDRVLHSTIQDRKGEIDERIHLMLDPHTVETNRRLANIEAITAENTKVLYEIKGELRKGQ